MMSCILWLKIDIFDIVRFVKIQNYPWLFSSQISLLTILICRRVIFLFRLKTPIIVVFFANHTTWQNVRIPNKRFGTKSIRLTSRHVLSLGQVDRRSQLENLSRSKSKHTLFTQRIRYTSIMAVIMECRVTNLK